MRKFALAITLACVAALMTNSSEAAPVGTTSSTLKSAGAELTDVVAVAPSRCWWRDGKKHCPPAAGRVTRGNQGSPAGSDYYEQIANKARVGSQRWWDLKEREGSTGKP